MLVELIMFALVAAFVAICVLGHVLLAAAIVQCVREDLSGGRRHGARTASRRTGAARIAAPGRAVAFLDRQPLVVRSTAAPAQLVRVNSP